MAKQLSSRRLTAVRVVFFLNFVYVGGFVLRAFIGHVGAWDPVRGVAYSFWAALALVSALGVRAPLSMVPVLLVQFVYKCIWLLAIYLPATANGGAGLMPVMIGGALVDVLVIPWRFVLSAYILGGASERPSIFNASPSA